MNTKFKNITIIGVGLIGGSIGLAVKRKKLAGKVTGVTAHRGSLQKAVKLGAIDAGTLDVVKSVRSADLVVICTPVDTVVKTIKRIRKHLRPGCIVTDVASTKSDIVSGAEKALSGNGAAFVGVHPMAGSEKRGVDEARADLFKGAKCIITTTRNTDEDAAVSVARFWADLGANVGGATPAFHDQVMSEVSHLPHIVAAALCSATSPEALFIAATGFADTTRIASGDPSIWTPIVTSNRKNMLSSIDKYLKELHSFRAAIKKGDRRRINVLLKGAKRKRDKITMLMGKV